MVCVCLCVFRIGCVLYVRVTEAHLEYKGHQGHLELDFSDLRLVCTIPVAVRTHQRLQLLKMSIFRVLQVSLDHQVCPGLWEKAYRDQR